jgi:hypothetical protein
VTPINSDVDVNLVGCFYLFQFCDLFSFHIYFSVNFSHINIINTTNTMSKCKVCSNNINKKHLKLSCAECKCEFHGNCVNMSQADVSYLEEINTVWRCNPCSEERRKSMRLDSSIQEGNLTLEDLMKVLNDIKEEQKKTKNDFNGSYEALHAVLSDNSDALQNALAKIEDFSKVMDNLRTENAGSKKKVCELESRIEDMEQYSRRNFKEYQRTKMKMY